MKLYVTSLALLGLLAGCGGDAPSASEPAKPAVEAAPEVPVMGREVPVLAIGDSLFTGHGLEEGQDYPSRLEAALRARGVNARIVNAGVTGDTTAGGLQRLDFTLKNQGTPPELVIVSLGGNDMLRGLPPEQTRANLDAMLSELKARKISVVLLGMLAAPNLGKDYESKFNPIYPTLAKKYRAALVPFFLQPLMDRPDLVQKDHVHPTEAGIDAMVAATVDRVVGALPEQDGK